MEFQRVFIHVGVVITAAEHLHQLFRPTLPADILSSVTRDKKQQ